jgi:vancomycin aglycone glucosyltransferase
VVALAMELQNQGAPARVCAPPDFQQLLDDAGVPLIAAGRSVRELVHGTGGGKPVTSADAPRVAAELVRTQFAAVAEDDCFAVGEVNHRALFGQVAAVVHHGGAGTTTTAALAGAPQLVVLQMADQPYWGSRVAALGIGAAHDGPTPTTESLSAALRTTLTPETRTRATAVACTVRTDGAATAAHRLLSARTTTN